MYFLLLLRRYTHTHTHAHTPSLSFSLFLLSADYYKQFCFVLLTLHNQHKLSK